MGIPSTHARPSLANDASENFHDTSLIIESVRAGNRRVFMIAAVIVDLA
jgi:hypothetical protein